MINRVTFYEKLRTTKLFSSLTQKQVNSIDAVLNYWEQTGYTDLRWLAYIFGTMKHETAHTMLPIEEYGKGKGRPYGTMVKHSGVVYSKPNKLFYGRGYIQLTWYENYELMGRLIGADLLNAPELALQPDIATKIMFEGMTKGSSSFGDFTGKCLEQYFNKTTEDWKNARRIINGLDRATEIGTIAQKFLTCLK